MLRVRIAALLIVLAMLAAMPAALPVIKTQAQTTITIGALLPLTGDLSDYGVRAEATLKVAIEDVNAYLEQKGAWFRLDLRVEDTATNPDTAVQKLNTLISAGIKFVVGPMTSAEVTKIKDLANQNNVLVISPSSTAIELAIAGDNVFRFCPDDSVQSKVIAKIAEDFGIKAAVMIVRADTWGQGLRKSIASLFDQAGIEYKYYEYNPESPNFAAIAASAAQDVQAYIDKYGADKVAVVLIAFKEAADLFGQAKGYDSLRQVIWLGSDGTAKLSTIANDIEAAAFAQDTLFLNPIFSPAATKNQERIVQKVVQDIGEEPDAYSYAAYDAVWAIALALLDADPNGTPDDWVNHVKAKLEQGITTSDEFAAHSATGAFPLNEAGDRATADYDLWMVYNGEWVLIGKYYGNENRVEWFKVDALGGKTYVNLVKEKFQAAKPTPTTSPTQTTPTETSPTATSPSPTETETETTTTAGGLGAGTLVAVIIIIIIVAAAAFMLTRKK